MARSLPKDWPVEISFAENGEEGMKVIREGGIDFVFLDLNMPVMDGYQVLETMMNEGIVCKVVVVSGDIQPEAKKRVTFLGALDFIKKPADKEKIETLLFQLGVLGMDEASAVPVAPAPAPAPEPAAAPAPVAAPPPPPPAAAPRAAAAPAKAVAQSSLSTADLSETYRDSYQEIANVAMGQAADLLARVLEVFVLLPIPNVNMIEVSELKMALTTAQDETISAVCQGFIGSGVAGEALLIFNDSSFNDIAKLMKYRGEIDDIVELELLMDVASILIGACLKGIAEQLDVHFSQGHPVVLGQHVPLDNLLKSENVTWKKSLAIEITYAIENYNIQCDLLILFTEDSLKYMNQKIAYMLDE